MLIVEVLDVLDGPEPVEIIFDVVVVCTFEVDPIDPPFRIFLAALINGNLPYSIKIVNKNFFQLKLFNKTRLSAKVSGKVISIQSPKHNTAQIQIFNVLSLKI